MTTSVLCIRFCFSHRRAQIHTAEGEVSDFVDLLPCIIRDECCGGWVVVQSTARCASSHFMSPPPPPVSSMSLGVEDVTSKLLHQQMKDYLSEQSDAMESRIR